MMKFPKKHFISSLVLVFVLVAAMAIMLVSCDKSQEVGKGENTFTFVAEFPDGTSKEYTVKTEKGIVGDALIDEGLIAGDAGAYGLYVKTVDGVTLDYDKDGKYWAFYVDGSYAAKGVDSTAIEEGKVYSFKAE